ncbi:phage integrase SAM-like domain-containing protein, partial [uncultured Duncaniella sp.]
MRYRKTISELEIFLAGHRIHVADLSEMMMADWAIDLLCQGLAVSTVTRHLNSLNGMVKDAAKAGMIKQNN